MLRDDLETARNHANKVLERDGKNARAYAVLGACAEKQNDFKEVLNFYFLILFILIRLKRKRRWRTTRKRTNTIQTMRRSVATLAMCCIHSANPAKHSNI